ncbi:MAG: S1 RNA-binding domain-containing protein, partial [Actinomycetia bacterium]|nr:S1 RNA-binding domain-containing protein [Actinomycetes bacterium]
MASTDRHLVVDGSNIATEGRSLPSLTQLDEAVRAISAEYNYDSLTVIVDATFAHRINESERAEFEEAVLAGEIVAPPAGAVGRGDAFILQVAAKANAVVFSNDSFQEFHGEHDWLFEEGRLIGGKPIGGIGWIFVERVPVRGPTSRRAVREAEDRSTRRRKSKKKATTSRKATSGPAPKPTRATPPPAKKAQGRQSQAKKTPSTSKASSSTATPKQSGSESDSNQPTKTRKQQVEELNDARSFISFITSHSIGDELEAEVERFSSHGCYLRATSARCYLPSRAMGDPPPSRARDVVSIGQRIIVKVESIDSDRRGINVTLVRADLGNDKSKSAQQPQNPSARGSRQRNSANTSQDSEEVADDSGRERNLRRSTSTVATNKAAKPATRKRPAGRTSTKKKAAKKGSAKATTSARVERATAKKAPAKRAPARKPAAKKATPAKKTAAKKAPAKKPAAKKATPAKKT